MEVAIVHCRWLEQGEEVSAVEYAAARILSDECVGQINSMFAKSQIDLLACPAAQAPAHYDVRAQH
eukprot:COSAG01_NODE_68489_length_264_cov_0.606061_1_plen_65_part_10